MTNIKTHGQEIHVTSAPIDMPVFGHNLRFTPTEDFVWGTSQGALKSGEACTIKARPDLGTWEVRIGTRLICHSSDLRQAIARLENNLGRPYKGADILDRLMQDPDAGTESIYEMPGGGQIYTNSPEPEYPVRSARMAYRPANDAQWGSENFELLSDEGYRVKLTADAKCFQIGHGQRLLATTCTLQGALGVAERDLDSSVKFPDREEEVQRKPDEIVINGITLMKAQSTALIDAITSKVAALSQPGAAGYDEHASTTLAHLSHILTLLDVPPVEIHDAS